MLEPGSQPRALYLAARRLSRENREWSFVLFAHRAIALGEVQVERLNGLDLCYEPLSTWDEVVTVLNLRRALLDADIPPEMTMEVTVGMEVFDSIFRASAGRLPLPSSGSRFVAGTAWPSKRYPIERSWSFRIVGEAHGETMGPDTYPERTSKGT